MLKIKPCPECNKIDMVSIQQPNLINLYWVVKCCRCQLTTDKCRSKKAAKRSWNMRAIHHTRLRKIMQKEDENYGN